MRDSKLQNARGHGRASTWPTWVVAVCIYGGWLAATWFQRALPWPVLMVAGGWITAWQMSLQHEVIHGRPSRRGWVNDLLGLPPLSLFLPYAIYSESHLAHHASPDLTHPHHDPESFYGAGDGPVSAMLAQAGNTLAGRLALGPGSMVAATLAQGWRDVVRGEPGRRRIWAAHAAGVAAVLGWVWLVCGLPVWTYVGCFVWPGLMLSLIRSFAEHRDDAVEAHRTAAVENAPLFGLLFLHNNLHVVHHMRPDLPWYELPRVWRAERARLLRLNGHHVYDGYREVFARYLLTAHHEPAFGAPRLARVTAQAR